VAVVQPASPGASLRSRTERTSDDPDDDDANGFWGGRPIDDEQIIPDGRWKSKERPRRDRRSALEATRRPLPIDSKRLCLGGASSLLVTSYSRPQPPLIILYITPAITGNYVASRDPRGHRSCLRRALHLVSGEKRPTWPLHRARRLPIEPREKVSDGSRRDTGGIASLKSGTTQPDALKSR
jgi:hypothetical protein